MTSSFRWCRLLALCLPLAAGAQEENAAESASPKTQHDWATFLAEAKMPPLVIPATSTFTQAFHERQLAWLRRVYGEAELARLKTAPQAEPKGVFLERAMRWWARLEPGTDPAPLAAEGAALLESQGGQPLTAFLIGELLHAANQTTSAKRWWLTARSQANAASLPAALVALVDARRLAAADDAKEKAVSIESDLLASLGAAWADGSYLPDEAPVLVGQFASQSFAPIVRPRAARLAEVVQASPLPEWVRLTLVGHCESELAWSARGPNFGRDVTEEQWAGFRRHLREARAALSEAWRLRPDVPEAASRMIGVAMGESAGLTELRVWFDRAIAARCDHTPALNSMFHALQPRWAGNPAARLAFGVACADTARWDTPVPEALDRALRETASEVKDWRKLYTHPPLAARLLAMRRGYMAHAPAMEERQRHAAELVVEAWAQGDFALAKATLATLPEPVPAAGPKHARSFSADWEVLCGEVLNSEAWQKANRVLAEFDRNFATGAWTSLPLDTRLAWSVREGSWQWHAARGRLVTRSESTRARFLFRGNLGAQYEVRGRFVLPLVARARAGAGIVFGHRPPSYPWGALTWWSLRAVGRGTEPALTGLSNGFRSLNSDLPGDEVALRTENTFLARLDGRRVAFWINDQPVLEKHTLPETPPAELEAFGLGYWTPEGAPPSEMWDCAARRLPAKGGQSL